jgi:hypothetical protein
MADQVGAGILFAGAMLTAVVLKPGVQPIGLHPSLHSRIDPK